MTSSFKDELVSEACKSFFSSPRCFSPGSRTQISTFVYSLLLPVQANPLPQCLGRNGELLSLSRACEDEVALSKLTEGWYMQRPRSSHFRTDRLDSSSIVDWWTMIMWECSPRCNAQVTQTPVPVTGQRVTLLQAVTTYKGTTRNFNTNLPVSPSYPGAPPPPPLPVPAKTPPPLLPQVDCEESFICSDSKSSESNCSSSRLSPL